jgi:hypothetical protein
MSVRNNPIRSYLGQVLNDELVIDGLYGRARKKFQSAPIFYATCRNCKSRQVVTFADYKNGTAKCVSSLCVQRHLRESSERRDDLSTRREWKQGLANDRAETERQEQQRIAEAAERQREQADVQRKAVLAEESGYNFYARTKQRVHDTPISFDLWLQQTSETRTKLLGACKEVARKCAENEAPEKVDRQFEDWQKQNSNGSLSDWLLEKELQQA